MEITKKELIDIAHRNPLECLMRTIEFILQKERHVLTKEQLIDLEAVMNNLKRDFDTNNEAERNAHYINSKGKLKEIFGIKD